MSKLIYLSPSDQINNKYAYGNTTEAIQCRKISDATETALKRNGFSVINDKTNDMWGRVKESNANKADLHICIHTNASNGTVSGTRIFSFDLKGEGYKAANAIFNILAPLTPGKSENIKTSDFYEIMYTNASCVYIECEFHDVAETAKWIIEHTKEIGEAIAEGVCKYYGVTFKKEETTPPTSFEKGSVVQFKGGSHYKSASADTPSSTNLKAGPAKITKISKGAKHPYHIVHTDNQTTVYGWVDAASIGAPINSNKPTDSKPAVKKNVITEDGLWGRDTTKYTQKFFGTPQDSIVSNQLNSCKKYLPNMLETSWEFENTAKGGSVMVVKLQTLIGANPDGYAGIDTIMKLQVFLRNLGLYTGKIDGIAGYGTVIGWQKYLNMKLS